MMTTTNTTSQALITEATEALNAGRWSQAQKALDELARRTDYVGGIWPQPSAPGFISDRIALVNSKAEDNAEAE